MRDRGLNRMLEHPLIWLAARALGSWVLVVFWGATALWALRALTAPVQRLRAYRKTRAFLPAAEHIFRLGLVGDECHAFSGLCLNALLIVVYPWQIVACVVAGMILLLVGDSTSSSSMNLFRSELQSLRERLVEGHVERQNNSG